MRVAPPIVLSPEERARLGRLRGRTGVRRLHAEIVLLASQGLQDIEIGRRLGVDRQTAARWRRRFRASRTRGLDQPLVTVRPGRIPEEKLQAVVRATVARSAPGGRPWSTRRLGRALGVSHMTVRRVWESYGIRPVRFEAFPPRADPIPARTPWDVIGLYLHAPVSALVVTLHSTDGGASISGRTPEGAMALPPPLQPGTGGGVARNAPAFRFLPAESAPGLARAASKRGFLRFIAELAILARNGTGIRVLATGVPPSEAALLDRWRVRHPQFEFEFVPEITGWQHRARGELLATSHGSQRAGQFRGRAETSRSLARFLGGYSNGNGAFEWRARRSEIEEGEAAYRLRYDLAVTGHPGFKSPEPLATSMTASADRDDGERASARTVLRQYLRVRPKERVTIESWSSTLGYANAFVLESLRLGARPLLLYQDEPTYWAATTEVPAKSLASIGEHRRAALERTDAFVSFFGPSDRERYHALPAATMSRLCEHEDSLHDAAAKAGARTVQLAIGRISDASARMYGVDAAVWRRELLDATRVSPAELHRRAKSLAAKLGSGRELEIGHSNGTQLRLRLRGRKPHVFDGTVARAPSKGDWNMVTLPAGVVTVAVDESFAEGSFRSNVRCSTGLSDSVGEFAGGRWTFEGGRLRKYAYDEGQELFAQSYGRAHDGRDRPGSVSIGLNEHIATAPLLEDQSRGMVSLLIGRNDSVGGQTRTPWWAWMFLRGSTLTVDGEPIVQSGSLRP